MINTIQELKEFLGKSHTIGYHSPNAKKAIVDNKKIDLPIKKDSLVETLKKGVA